MQIIKKGFFTSEFWLAALAIVVPEMASLLQQSGSSYASLAGVALAALYTHKRTELKASYIDAVLGAEEASSANVLPPPPRPPPYTTSSTNATTVTKNGETMIVKYT